MTKVYILMGHVDYEGDGVIGVFSTKEKAENVLKHIENRKGDSQLIKDSPLPEDSFWWQHYSIDEVVIAEDLRDL